MAKAALAKQIGEAQESIHLDTMRKTCFEKCFPRSYPSSLGKGDKICLAKCMDRITESHAIVSKACIEMAQNLQSNLDMQ
eukprot:CAMPEP_0204329638 /NCGR_PEP_ID=MMETSP0469-20131031/14313_1 /ASSEMBLY_ACC=CAM_ASM_000384 /TAXON_ID=2969 /ORGANISM="Oxyrrhis marina" /LENGTH=79 /DNA_ID=CAMNT_0051312285 /DNA_START=17 /DNA_END=256 /DNA_ORIENTATION=+